jgi:hypothetical protein
VDPRLGAYLLVIGNVAVDLHPSLLRLSQIRMHRSPPHKLTAKRLTGNLVVEAMPGDRGGGGGENKVFKSPKRLR